MGVRWQVRRMWDTRRSPEMHQLLDKEDPFRFQSPLSCHFARKARVPPSPPTANGIRSRASIRIRPVSLCPPTSRSDHGR